ncbi:MAG: Adenylate kinase [Candidatus Amesbacteria bacterium GW2011_GWB1_47_19]|nr:MAG: Adenylate kinase [Candidatus Amesbacteria bacterium GW2011_GWA1_44_24]KKU32045.1 MAG: Adenylate kinase [Candidatus Amesbacteria bacterium GW2011_GWC1_46_24]KKU67729.1 MAG: Adenylate kinase [Candidatus Amesbacteria bacterium GW2011_GWB1_47_19]OGD06086.1 MAG: hypothetical protein A2379_03260 [Candidatus Amesbacteria bacterium RIFOXYB1_FULL_47_13]HBC72323.1 adenylate kinase [Candidatus Amesbacteria bacterium]
MNVAIIGPQGCGKGTQAQLLADKSGLDRVETGKILREIAETNHPWGKRIKNMMLKGVLVSDDILLAVLKETLLKDVNNGFVFDGTPRNLSQYELIKEILKKKGEKLNVIILLEISEAETVRRISSRRTCSKCGRVYNLVTNPPPAEKVCECGGELVHREDDFPEAIIKRLGAYRRSTLKVVDAARREGILVEVDGERPIEEIHSDIISKLQILNPK